MNLKIDQKVTAVNGTAHAISLQNVLESAGIPVTITNSRDGDYLDVLVPCEYIYEARNLLNPERRSGEIYSEAAAIE